MTSLVYTHSVCLRSKLQYKVVQRKLSQPVCIKACRCPPADPHSYGKPLSSDPATRPELLTTYLVGDGTDFYRNIPLQRQTFGYWVFDESKSMANPAGIQ